jgi:hypothetical protein
MFRLAVAATMMAIAVPAFSADAPATGANVRSATYGRGVYRQTGPRTWGEFDSAGKQTNSFVEEARDEWSVFLFDPGRNVRVQIDLYRKKIRYAENGGSYADLYDVTGAAAGIAPAKGGEGRPTAGAFGATTGFWTDSPVRYGVGPGGGTAGGSSRGVETAAIASQSDADRRCPETARAVNGVWTGQWRAGQGTYPALCLIRFARP